MWKRPRSADAESGQILIQTALSLLGVLAIAALSLDASYMYDKRNRLHAAADAAAKTGAIEVQRNGAVSNGELVTFANQQVTAHGFNPAGSTVVVVNRPPTSGVYNGNSGYVEAIVSEPTSTFFGVILGMTNMTPRARAVAGYSNPTNCLITLRGPGSSPYSFEIGNSTMTMNNCGVASAGDINGSNPNATVTGSPTPSVTATGNCSGTCGAMGTLSTGSPAPTDPLAGLAAPSIPAGGCIPGVLSTIGPGCYTSIATSVQNMTSGIYYVTGLVEAQNLTGTNVLLYLAPGGQLRIGNNDDLVLTAQTSGTYNGIAIFQDPSNSNDFDVRNNATINVTGMIYMPAVDIDINNSISWVSTGCNPVIANSLSIRNGNGAMNVSSCASTYGGAAFLSVSIAE